MRSWIPAALADAHQVMSLRYRVQTRGPWWGRAPDVWFQDTTMVGLAVSGFRTLFPRCAGTSFPGVAGHRSRVWRDIVPDCDNEQERSDHLRDHRSRYVHQRGSTAILALSPLDQSAARALPRRRYRRTRSPVPTPTHQPQHHQRSDPREGYRTAP